MTAPSLVAISPALWEHPDDPEAGYVHAENVAKCRWCKGHGEVEEAPLGAMPWDEYPVVACTKCDGLGHIHAETLRPLVPVMTSRQEAA